MTLSVLIVEDDPDIVELVTLDMRDLGFVVEAAADGETGLSLAQSKTFSLLILDLMLPGLGGIEVCRRLRASNPALPIMMLTARDDDVSMVLGFETGADEYLTKPYKSVELKARVRALLRRSAQQAQPASGEAKAAKFGELVIDHAAREVVVAGERIVLTAIEFDLLVFLSASPGRVYTRQDLLQGVWGVETAGYEYNVNTHVSRLRTKLKTRKSGTDYILTLRGVGYRFIRADELDKDKAAEER